MFVCCWLINGFDRLMLFFIFISLWEWDQFDRMLQNYLCIYWIYFCVLNVDKQIYVKFNCIKFSIEVISFQ